MQQVLGTNILIDTTGNFSGVIKLNQTMADVIAGIQAGQELDEIARILCSKYDVSFDKALADASRVCDELAKQGVLES